MHVSGDSSEGRSRRTALVLLALVVLLAVVAIASSGHVPIGTNDARRPADEFLDTLISLILVLVLAGSLGIFYVYYLQRTNSNEERRKGVGGKRRSLLVVIVLVAVLFGLGLRVAIHNRQHRPPGSGLAGSGVPASERDRSSYTPRFATIPVAVILGAAGLAGLAAYLSHRAGRRTVRPLGLEPSLALTLADVLAETLDDLRAEPDPRVAVVAAYARLERTLAASGLPRRVSDAPAEYLRRILVDLEVSAGHASRLTQLFERAKFSPHDVGPELKEEAIVLLEWIRADLQAAEAAREAARLAARTAEQPA